MKFDFKKVLTFFRVIDAHDGMVSLTNLAVLIVLIKLAIVPSTTVMDIGTLLVALTNYTGKKLINKQEPEVIENPLLPQFEQMQKTIEQLESSVTALNLQSGIKNL